MRNKVRLVSNAVGERGGGGGREALGWSERGEAARRRGDDGGEKDQSWRAKPVTLVRRPSEPVFIIL